MVITKNDLSVIPAFQGLPPEALNWIEQNAKILTLADGDYLFEKGGKADHLYAILSGRIQVKFEIGGQLLPFGVIEPGEITGLLPYSRMKEASGYGYALGEVRVLTIHRDLFPEMERTSSELVRRLVEIMTNRVREGTRSVEQREKMSALGKLSAGLAHELNNPASAIKRNAVELKKQMELLPAKVHEMMIATPSPEMLSKIMSIIKKKEACDMNPNLSIVERGELEDDLADWLEEQDVEDPFGLAASFLDAGIRPEDLEQIKTEVSEDSLPQLLKWLEGSLSAKRLIYEIEEAANRISGLVGSIKSYTHMDQSPAKEDVNIHDGLDNTLVMLNHKIKKKNIVLDRHYDSNLPLVNAFPGELNQVWTNLIDNALDALQQGGELTIMTRFEGGVAKVCIRDNGPGIPEEIQGKIFEPFFTTKPQGQGTGLGLDIVGRIVQNHGGNIHLKSEPGETEFIVVLPVPEKE